MEPTMATQVQRIIEQAKRLPARERRRVVSAIAASLSPVPEDTPRRSARRRSYASLQTLAGTAHAEVPDVSQDKYTRVAAAYADDEA
jgi:hypothetical protein